jgi:hypothetical protein
MWRAEKGRAKGMEAAICEHSKAEEDYKECGDSSI